MVHSTVKPVHFEDYGGAEFERLVFAYHVRAGWIDLQWQGQVGSDKGRDIVGTEVLADGLHRRTIIQCANRKNLALVKATEDIHKATGASSKRPDAFKFVCRSSVSSKVRDAIAEVAKKERVKHVTIWSGSEFEEHLRLRGEFLLRRFLSGVPFPESEKEIRRFADDFPDLSDNEALSLIAAVFDRPAFRTPFQEEANLPAFQKAIEDTIQALSTGIWRTREGDEIRRLPSIHHLKAPSLRAAMQKVVSLVDALRGAYVTHLRAKRIRHCQCGDPNCPVFMMDREAIQALENARNAILREFGAVFPAFDVRVR